MDTNGNGNAKTAKTRTLYVVAWHEENESGVPVHAMGATTFDTEFAAKQWIDRATAEDKARHDESDFEGKTEFVDETVDDGIVHTYGNGQHMNYKVVPVQVEDYAVSMMDDIRRVFDEEIDAIRRSERVEDIIRDYKRRIFPKRKFKVYVTFAPTICVKDVEAVDEDDARKIVSDKVDDRTLVVDTDQVMPDLLENCAEIEDVEEME